MCARTISFAESQSSSSPQASPPLEPAGSYISRFVCGEIKIKIQSYGIKNPGTFCDSALLVCNLESVLASEALISHHSDWACFLLRFMHQKRLMGISQHSMFIRNPHLEKIFSSGNEGLCFVISLL